MGNTDIFAGPSINIQRDWEGKQTLPFRTHTHTHTHLPMGIHTQWIDRLKGIFGWPKMSAEDACNIDFIVDDAELSVRRLFGAAEKWEDVSARAVERVMLMLNAKSAKCYYLLFDDPKYVPTNKGIEQSMRNRSAEPFNPAEQRAIKVGESAIPVPSAEFFSRFMATRPLRVALRSYLALSLCKTKLPPGKRIVVDAVVPRVIVSSSGSGYTVTNLDEVDSADASSSAAAAAAAAAAVASIGLDIDVGSATNLDEPTIITITGREDGTGNDVHVSPKGNEVGEADFKIPYWISRLPSSVPDPCPEDAERTRKPNVFVRSYDTDTFTILLLNMRRWCERRYDDAGKPVGNIKYNIFVDANAPQRKRENARDVLNFVAFYTDIFMTLRVSHPNMRHPIEMLCTILLLCGSDYLKIATTNQTTGDLAYLHNHRGLGPAGIWNAFQHPTGIKILYPSGMEAQPPVKIESVVDDVESCIRIQIDEKRIYNFIAFAHHKNILGEWADLALFRDYYNYSNIRRAASGRQMPVHSKDIYVFIRQLAWNLGYLVNGLSTAPFDNPFAQTHDGTSIYGWQKHQGQDGTKVSITSKIVGSPFAELVQPPTA